MKIVEIIWRDAYGGNYQVDKDELINGPQLICKSVGYLVAETKDRLFLCFTEYPDKESFKHWQVIPKSLIVKKRVLQKH